METSRKAGWKPVPAALCALALFLLVNFAAAPALESLRFEDNGSGSFSGMVHEFISLNPPADVVCLGSSVMRSPFWGADAANYKGTPPFAGYHRLRTLQDRLAQAHLSVANSFNLAVDGSMPTDVYLIVDKLLTGKHCPRLIVYGIAPRDFIDSFMSSETKTVAFDRLFSVADVFSAGSLYASGPMQCTDMFLNRLLAFYGLRQPCQSSINDLVTRNLPSAGGETNKVVSLPSKVGNVDFGSSSIKIDGTTDGASLKVPEIPADMHGIPPRLAAVLHPGKIDTWSGNLIQYSLRYWNPDPARFNRQKEALRRLLKIAADRHIKVLLVNMPLAADNVKLLEPALYQQYLEAISSACTSANAQFLNLQDNPAFTRRCYMDTVHLNGIGGDKLILQLVSYIRDHNLLPDQPGR